MKINLVKNNIPNLESVKDAPALNIAAKEATIDMAKKHKEFNTIANPIDKPFTGRGYPDQTAKSSDLKKMKLSESLFEDSIPLKEDGRQNRYNLTPEEKADERRIFSTLFGRVMSELDDEAHGFEIKSNIVKLPKKLRYDSEDISTDYDSNIIVYAPNKDKLASAIKVAEAYNLKYDIKSNNSSVATRYPRHAVYIRIYCGDEEESNPEG